jgi:uncharacterized repeat protein (TIGR01451 family)
MHKRTREVLFALCIGAVTLSQGAAGRAQSAQGEDHGVRFGRDVRHDVSPALRDIPPKPYVGKKEHEANLNPRRTSQHKNEPDPVIQSTADVSAQAASFTAGLNFDGIGFPGVACNCAPPDTNGAVGGTQYVQIVNEGLAVFDKASGATTLSPRGISTLWNGFGGVCETNGFGDPVVLYDQLAGRWVISQFAGVSVPTDECVAVSTTSDATGSYYRYGFHLGSNFFDYPKLGVWPDAYYMSMNVFNSAGTAFLGPQPFAFDRTKMLAGQTATFVTTGITGGSSEESYLPSDLDGSTPPPDGAPNTFIEFPSGGQYKMWQFHVDFDTPGNSTFLPVVPSPTAAGFVELCPTTRSCVPQSGTLYKVDGIGDRLMFRAAYRNFGDHDSIVTNYTVNANSGAGVRWVEIRNITTGTPTTFQESSYRPDSTWRWMGSAAMDKNGNLAVGFSASSSTLKPQIRYAGRLAADPINTLGGETTLLAGTGSQTGTSSRWGDYSALTVDPVDDCTFWYTNEYYSTTASFNWRTRIGTFKFSDCNAVAPGTLTGTVTNSSSTAIGGALVQVAGGPSTTTNGSGQYTLSLAPGDYSVTFSASGFVSKTLDAHIDSALTTILDASLTPAPPSLSITKTADAPNVNSGSRAGFTITLSNAGGAASNVSVNDDLPPASGVNWSIASQSGGWSLTGSVGNQVLTFGPGTLDAATNTSVHVTSPTTNQTCTTLPNHATFTSDAGAGSSAQVSVTVKCKGPKR